MSGSNNTRLIARIALIALGILVLFAVARLLFDGYYDPWHPFGRFGIFGPLGGLLGIWGLINLGLGIWVWVDGNKRGQNGLLWGALTFFTGVVGLIVYLIVVTGIGGTRLTPGEPFRSAEPAVDATGVNESGPRCRECNEVLRDDFKLCPYCGTPTTEDCRSCGKPLQAGWRICPHCGAPRSGDQAAS